MSAHFLRKSAALVSAMTAERRAGAAARPVDPRTPDDFRFAEHCPSRSEAIRTLMQRGLQASRGRTEKGNADV